MSRSYKIKVSEGVFREVHIKDGIETSLPVIPILSPEETNLLLGQQLKQQGFEEDDDGTFKKTLENGVLITIDTKERKVSATVGKETTIETQVTKTETVYEEINKKKKISLKEEAKKEAEKLAKIKEEKVQEEITKLLEKSLGDIQQEIDQAINKTLSESLKKRASQLGEIQSIDEDPETGSLEITVKL